MDAQVASLEIPRTEIVPQLEDAESDAEVEELFMQDDFIEAEERFGRACLALQGIADKNGIEVDLKC